MQPKTSIIRKIEKNIFIVSMTIISLSLFSPFYILISVTHSSSINHLPIHRVSSVPPLLITNLYFFYSDFIDTHDVNIIIFYQYYYFQAFISFQPNNNFVSCLFWRGWMIRGPRRVHYLIIFHQYTIVFNFASQSVLSFQSQILVLFPHGWVTHWMKFKEFVTFFINHDN